MTSLNDIHGWVDVFSVIDATEEGNGWQRCLMIRTLYWPVLHSNDEPVRASVRIYVVTRKCALHNQM